MPLSLSTLLPLFLVLCRVQIRWKWMDDSLSSFWRSEWCGCVCGGDYHVKLVSHFMDITQQDWQWYARKWTILNFFCLLHFFSFDSLPYCIYLKASLFISARLFFYEAVYTHKIFFPIKYKKDTHDIKITQGKYMHFLLAHFILSICLFALLIDKVGGINWCFCLTRPTLENGVANLCTHVCVQKGVNTYQQLIR